MGDDASARPVAALCFLPLDAAAHRTAGALVEHVSRRLPWPCRLLPTAEVGEWPLLEGRDQVDADRLLERLERTVPDVAQADEAVVGLTSFDIGSPLFTHFFGRARQGGRAAVVSLVRLSPAFYGLEDDEALTRRRAVAEVVHEVGHVLGLGHCHVASCVMRFVANAAAIDVRGDAFCPACTGLLPEALTALASGSGP